MNLTGQLILDLIQKGESITLEFKESRNGINRSVYETVCAFLNRHGATLLIGVNDSGTLVGVRPDSLDSVKKISSLP